MHSQTRRRKAAERPEENQRGKCCRFWRVRYHSQVPIPAGDIDRSRGDGNLKFSYGGTMSAIPCPFALSLALPFRLRLFFLSYFFYFFGGGQVDAPPPQVDAPLPLGSHEKRGVCSRLQAKQTAEPL